MILPDTRVISSMSAFAIPESTNDTRKYSMKARISETDKAVRSPGNTIKRTRGAAVVVAVVVVVDEVVVAVVVVGAIPLHAFVDSRLSNVMNGEYPIL
jgi:hypothetical protein